jgi:hypothetical protein
MLTPLLLFSLSDCVVEYVSTADSTLLIDARVSMSAAVGPDCHTPTMRVHSCYTGRLRDLPIVAQPVGLRLGRKRR